MAQTHGRASSAQLAAYAAPAISIAAIGLPITVYLPDYYHTELGMDLGLVGVIFLVARFWDIFTDPFAGALIDGTRRKIGDKNWLAMSVPVLCLGAWLVFFVDETASAASILAGFVVLYIGFTLNAVSHLSWGVSLAQTNTGRAGVQAWREAALVLGLSCVLAAPAIIELSGLGDRRDGIRVMGVFILVGAPLAAFIAYSFAPSPKARAGRNPQWKRAPGLLFKNRALRLVLAADLLSGFATGCVGTTFIMFARSVLLLDSASNLLLLAYFIAGTAGVPIWLIIARRLGLARTLAMAMAYSIMGLCVIGMLPPANIGAALIFFVIAGFGYGASSFLLRALTANLAADHKEREQEDLSGLYFGLLLLTNKLGLAVAVGIGLAFLNASGFQGDLGADNTPDALRALTLVFIATPCFMYALSAIAAIALDKRIPSDNASPLASDTVE